MYLVLRSNDRQPGSLSSTDFHIKLPTPLENLKSCELVNCQIPHSFYNVISGRNDKVYFRELSGNLLSATLNPGSYTAQSFIDHVATQMTTAGTKTYTGTYDEKTFKFTVSIDSSTFRFEFENTTDGANRQLGFDIQTTSYASSITSFKAIELNPQYLIIACDRLTKRIHSSIDAVPNATFFIPVNTNSGEIIEFDRKNSAFKQQAAFDFPTLSTLHIQLLDESGRVVDLQNAEWTLILHVFQQEKECRRKGIIKYC
jgi:hypothetical protein